MIQKINKLKKAASLLINLIQRIIKGKREKAWRISFPWILDRINRISQSARILDIGGIAGRGKVQDLTRELLKKGYQITEVDLRPITFKHPNLILKKENILKQDFPISTFDTVLAIHVLQHIGRRYQRLNKVFDNQGDRRLAKKIYKWLKPKGIAFIETTVASKPQELVWSKDLIWKIYTLELLKEIFSDFKVVDQLIYDGARMSRTRVKDAKSAVLMLQKP